MIYTPRLTDCDAHGQQVIVLDNGSNGQLVDRCVKCVRDRLAADGFCACDCGDRLGSCTGTSKYLSTKHRQGAHRADLRALAAALGIDASLSVKVVRSAGTTGSRRSDGETAGGVVRRRDSKPRKPQLRISYRKAVDAVANGLFTQYGDLLQYLTDDIAGELRAEAEKILKPLLTERQKAAL